MYNKSFVHLTQRMGTNTSHYSMECIRLNNYSFYHYFRVSNWQLIIMLSCSVCHESDSCQAWRRLQVTLAQRNGDGDALFFLFPGLFIRAPNIFVWRFINFKADHSDRSNTGILGTNPIWGMYVCSRFSMLSCPAHVETFRRIDPPSQSPTKCRRG
jgi:hypothetical protein